MKYKENIIVVFAVLILTSVILNACKFVKSVSYNTRKVEILNTLEVDLPNVLQEITSEEYLKKFNGTIENVPDTNFTNTFSTALFCVDLNGNNYGCDMNILYQNKEDFCASYSKKENITVTNCEIKSFDGHDFLYLKFIEHDKQKRTNIICKTCYNNEVLTLSFISNDLYTSEEDKLMGDKILESIKFIEE